jgi:hypothetical protein
MKIKITIDASGPVVTEVTDRFSHLISSVYRITNAAQGRPNDEDISADPDYEPPQVPVRPIPVRVAEPVEAPVRAPSPPRPKTPKSPKKPARKPEKAVDEPFTGFYLHQSDDEAVSAALGHRHHGDLDDDRPFDPSPELWDDPDDEG